MIKRVIAIMAALLVLAALLLGGGLWMAWDGTHANAVPAVLVRVLGHTATPIAYSWQAPVAGGLLHKPLQGSLPSGAINAGVFESATLSPAWPEGYATQITLIKDGAPLYEGDAASYADAPLTDAGSYRLQVHCVLDAESADTSAGTGSFDFLVDFAVEPPPPPPPPPPEPVFETGLAALRQGDIFTMRVKYLPEGLTPVADTTLGLAVFTPAEDGGWFCAVPVGNHCQPGSYTVSVQAGDNAWQAAVQVESYPYDEQNLIIDVTAPEITEANSAEAYAQYREKIPPLFDTWDDERYWEGAFIQPAAGWISTNFGAIRYTNSDYSNPRSHYGMDIANAEGTPILAPNHGRVVLAEYLLNTGYTIAIEHGGGLKSYYFHMSAISAEVGEMVEKGQEIGLMGTTGYSTGSHLHFEMRIGSQAISPQMLFEDTAGLYALEQAEAGDTLAA